MDYSQTFNHAREHVRAQRAENLKALVAEYRVGETFTLGFLGKSAADENRAREYFLAYGKRTGQFLVKAENRGMGGKHADSGVQFVGTFRTTADGLAYYTEQLTQDSTGASTSWGIICIYCEKPMTNEEVEPFGDSCESWHETCGQTLA